MSSRYRKGDRVRILSINESGVVKKPGQSFTGAFVRYTDRSSGKAVVWSFYDSDLRPER